MSLTAAPPKPGRDLPGPEPAVRTPRKALTPAELPYTGPPVRTVADAVADGGPELERWAQVVGEVKRGASDGYGAVGRHGRARRGRPVRRRGSRRGGSRGDPDDGESDDDGSSEPPGLRFWRHPDYGSVTADLLRLLLALPGELESADPVLRITADGVELRVVGS